VPTTQYDERGDVLYIDLAPGVAALSVELDDEEIFVSRREDGGSAIRFGVPFFAAHWKARLAALLDHLTSHAPDQRVALTACLLGIPHGNIALFLANAKIYGYASTR
jgi:uncharacterized protein YuzE